MSTLMSSDLNLTRPSTRLHAPPGGMSSISFGDTEPVQHGKRGMQGGSTSNTITSPSSTTQNHNAKLFVEDHKDTNSVATESKTIQMVISSTGVEKHRGMDVIKKAAATALYKNGNKINIVEVENPFTVPYVVKKICKQNHFDVIVVAVINVGVERDSSLSQILIPELVHFGMYSSVPVIPSVIQCDSILELNALIPQYCESWSRSVDDIMNEVVSENVTEDSDILKLALADMPKEIDLSRNDLQIDDLISAFRMSIKSHGATGIFSIGRKFKIIDDDNSGQIDITEFSKCIQEHCHEWNSKQIKILFDFFDKDKSNSIQYNEFLIGVREPMNDRRKQFVLQAFEILDTDKSGCVEVNDLIGKYDASKHPDVISGKRTSENVLNEFLSTFDSNNDGKVTVSEFIEYYSQVSASIDLDDYFELMMRNAWHISGGTGWCENSSCRRVLVIHTDGRETVEEVKNDLGIHGNDEPAIRAKLESQGILDIAVIKLTDAVSSITAPKSVTVTNKDLMSPKKELAAGQRVIGHDFLEGSNHSRTQAPGGKSSLVLG